MKIERPKESPRILTNVKDLYLIRFLKAVLIKVFHIKHFLTIFPKPVPFYFIADIQQFVNITIFILIDICLIIKHYLFIF